MTDSMERARRRMVHGQLEARGLVDPELLRAFGKVPRHRFVDARDPYGDEALPLAEGQTISQPFIVALMTNAARPAAGWRGAKVLEIGTGSGYQAAILAELGAEVISIERHLDLSRRAAERLTETGYDAVSLVISDGTRGWAAGAPYQAILVTAAGPSVPRPLLEQLADGGRMVMPVGGRGHQTLTVVQRHGDDFIHSAGESVVFVPLIGEFGVRE